MSSPSQNVSRRISTAPSSSRPKQRWKRCRQIPYRYITAILLCISNFAFFLMFISFEDAFSHLHEIGENFKSNYSIECKFPKRTSKVEHVSKDFYSWDPKSLDQLAKANGYGVLLGSLPSGVLSDKFGGKYVVLVPVIVLSGMEVIIPFLITGKDIEYYVFYVWQLLTGIGIAMMFCGTNSILVNWTPPHEIGKLGSIAFCSLAFAVMFHYLFTDKFIVATKMWNAPFLPYAIVGIAWTVCFVFFGFSFYHNKNQWMKQEEFDLLKKHLETPATFKRKTVPWLKLLTSLPVWAVTVAHVGHIWIWEAMVSNLDFYIRYVLYFDEYVGDALAAVAYMSMASLTVAVGYGADYLTNGGYVNVTTLRKVYTTFGAMAPAIFLLAAAYTGCHRKVAVAFFIMGMSSLCFYFGGTKINSLEIAPNFSGTIMGFMNMFDFIPALILPQVLEKIAPNQSLPEKRIMFWIHFGILTCTTVVYNLFGSADVQPWNYKDEEEELNVQGNEPSTSEQPKPKTPQNKDKK